MTTSVRLGIGRIFRGTIRDGAPMRVVHGDGKVEDARITKIFTFEGLKRNEVAEASAGEIIALAGMEDVDIGETICDPADLTPLLFVNIEEPTLSMNFVVNNSPFAGKEGKYVTTRNLADRLMRELRANVSLRVEPSETPDVFTVSGRGELHLAILIETMRREGYEFQVGKPQVITKVIGGQTYEPVEHAVIDVPDEYVGTVIDNLSRRKGEMKNLIPSHGNTRLEFIVPARGLIGFRTEFLTQTKGTGILHHNYHGYEPHKGEVEKRNKGAVVALETGTAVAYAMWKLGERMTFFIEPGTEVYSGMIVGESAREDTIVANVCRTKHLTNMRASGADEAIRLEPPTIMTVEKSIEWINEDEYVEFTPKSIRIRERVLDHDERYKARKRTAVG